MYLQMGVFKSAVFLNRISPLSFYLSCPNLSIFVFRHLYCIKVVQDVSARLCKPVLEPFSKYAYQQYDLSTSLGQVPYYYPALIYYLENVSIR